VWIFETIRQKLKNTAAGKCRTDLWKYIREEIHKVVLEFLQGNGGVSSKYAVSQSLGLVPGVLFFPLMIDFLKNYPILMQDTFESRKR
jgi:hypothetical protein